MPTDSIISHIIEESAYEIEEDELNKSTSFDGQIRIGKEYQATLPECSKKDEVDSMDYQHRAMLMWKPDKTVDLYLENYLKSAVNDYGYSQEQALALLYWHKHDIKKAEVDLANFTPQASQWSPEDNVVFEQALNMQGKDFRKIRQLLPSKTLGSLVEYYYSRSLAERSKPSFKRRINNKVKSTCHQQSVLESGRFSQYHHTSGPGQ